MNARLSVSLQPESAEDGLVPVTQTGEGGAAAPAGAMLPTLGTAAPGKHAPTVLKVAAAPASDGDSDIVLPPSETLVEARSASIEPSPVGQEAPGTAPATDPVVVTSSSPTAGTVIAEAPVLLTPDTGVETPAATATLPSFATATQGKYLTTMAQFSLGAYELPKVGVAEARNGLYNSGAWQAPVLAIQDQWGGSFTYDNGYYVGYDSFGVEMCSAFVLRCGDAIVLAFRGTQMWSDFLTDAFGMEEAFEEVQPLIDALNLYVTDPANGISQVQVTGHSLGGALAQYYMNDSKHANSPSVSYECVTFAAPGFNYGWDYLDDAQTLMAIAAGQDSRILHIESQGDPIAPLLFHSGYILQIEDQTSAGLNLLAEHAMLRYAEIAKFLDKEPGGTELVIPPSGLTLAVTVAGSELAGWTVGAGNNVITGHSPVSADSAVIMGGVGNDELGDHDVFTTGSLMYGGVGNDAYHVDDALDRVVEVALAGTDSVYATVSYTLPTEVENLFLRPTAVPSTYAKDIDGIGNALANNIMGNDGNNLLSGLDGFDLIKAGLGEDTLLGGLGNDSLYAFGGDDFLDGGFGNDLYALQRVDYDPLVSWSVPTYRIYDSGGGSDSLSIYDDPQGNLDGIEDLKFRLVGNDLWIDMDVDLLIDDDDEGRIIISGQALANNAVESVRFYDELGVPQGSAYSLISAYQSLLATGGDAWYRMTPGAVVLNGISLSANLSTAEPGSSGSVGTGAGITLTTGFTSTANTQLEDIGSSATFQITPAQAGAIELHLNADYSSAGAQYYRIDYYAPDGALLESLPVPVDPFPWFHFGVSSTGTYSIKVTNVGDTKYLGQLDNGEMTLSFSQADTTKLYEAEGNNSQASANAVTLGRSVVGDLFRDGDVDWYRVTPSQTGALALTFDDNLSGSGGGSHLYTVSVYDSSGTLLETFNYNSGYFETYHVGVASSASHYIKVSHDATQGALDPGWYQLTTAQASTTKDYESEGNNALTAADSLTLGRATEGQLSTATDVDWYRVSPSQVGALALDFNDNSSGGSHLYSVDVFDSTGSLLEHFDYSNGYEDVVHIGVASTSAHFIKVSHNATLGPLDTGWYNLTVSQAATTKDYESEGNNTLTSSDSVTLGRTTEGQLSTSSDVDWYRVTPSQVGALALNFNDNSSGGSHLYSVDVFNDAGALLEHFDYSSGNNETYHVGVASSSAHYIKISHDPAQGPLDTGWYNLTVSQASTAKDYESEGNNTLTTSDTITLGRTTEGQLSTSSDVDWYRVTPSQVGALALNFNDNSSGGSHLYSVDVFNDAGALLEHFDYNSGNNETFHVGVASPSAHYIKISHDAGLGPLDTGWYNLSVAQAPTTLDYETEGNSSLAMADAAHFGRTIEGQLSKAADVDVYRMDGVKQFTFRMDTSPYSYKAEFLSASGSVLNTVMLNTNWSISVDNSAFAQDTRYVRISYNPLEGALNPNWYTINWTGATPLQNVADTSTAEDSPFSLTVPSGNFINPGEITLLSATLSSGAALPTWLHFDAATLTLSGTPGNADVGALDIRLRATYNSGATLDDLFRLTVTNLNDAPTVTRVVSDVSINEDQAWALTLPSDLFSDVDTGDAITWSARITGGTGLPAWLSFDAATRRFTGTPGNDQVGEWLVDVVGTDKSGATGVEQFKITVLNVNDAPTTAAQAVAAQAGTVYTFSAANFPFSDVDVSDHLTKVKITSLPTSGALKLSGVAVSALQEITLADLMAGKLTYTAPAVAGTASFSFAVSDGSSYSAAAQMSLSITTAPVGGSTANDILLGTVAADALNGYEGDDLLVAQAGNDTLNGGAGADTMMGGEGSDVYYVDSLDDVIVEASGLTAVAGMDLVYSSVSRTLEDRVEQLVLTGTGNLNGIGNRLNNTLWSNAGNNLLDGGDGSDTVSYDRATAAVQVSLAIGTAQITGGAGTDTLLNIEKLIGSRFSDNLAGSASDNTLQGGSGNDTLDGGAGADTLLGGEGSDTYIVDNIADSVQEIVTNPTRGGRDLVQASVSYTLGSNLEDLALQGSANLNATGNALDNTLTANQGDNVINGGDGFDTVSYQTATSAVSVSLLKTTAQATGGSGSDTLVSIEGILGSGLSDTLVGNDLANLLSGGGGNDTLKSAAGNDTLIGGAGSDNLTGGVGRDIFAFTSRLGSDTITDFATGIDSLRIHQVNLPIGNGDAVVDGAVTTAGPGGFGTAAEVVVVSSPIVGDFSVTKVSAAIGAAASAYAVGSNQLFVINNGSSAGLYLFTAADADSLVEANELSLLATLSTTAVSTSDFIFSP